MKCKDLDIRVWDGKRMYKPCIFGLQHESFSWEHDRSSLHDSTQWNGEDGFIYDPDLMLGTSVYDKNGYQIFEKDILKFTSKHLYSNNSTEFIAIVVFKGGAFTIDVNQSTLRKTNGDYIHWKQSDNAIGGLSIACLGTGETIEIVGNIYQNSGLLSAINLSN